MSLLRRNIVWMLFSQVATWGVTLVLLVLAPNEFSIDEFGKLSTVTAFVGFFVLVGSLGSSQYIIKAVARDPSVVGAMVRSALWFKLLVGVGLSVLAMTLALILGYRGDVLVLLAVGCVGMMGSLFNEILIAGLAGMSRMARPAMWQTVQVYISTLVGIVVLLTSRSLIAFGSAFSLAIFVPVVANFVSLRPYLRSTPARPLLPWKPLIVGGAPLMLLAIVNLIYGTIDIPILKAVAGFDAVAWYSVAYKWVSMPIFITTIVVSAFLPSLAALAKHSTEEFNALTNRALRLVFVVTMPASTGLALVSSDLLDLVYRGDEYGRSVVLIQILAIHIPLAAVDTVLATALIACDRQNRYVLVAAAAAVINPPLVFAAIHITDGRYQNGAIGASIVTVLTELFIMSGALRLRPSGVLDRSTMGFFARCLVAAAAMAVPLLLLPDLWLFVKVIVGGVTFAVGSVALRLGLVTEARRLVSDIRRRRSGRTSNSNDGGSDDMSETGAEQ